LSAEQVAAVEALTRGLVNKFLHPPMQALKQAARENNQARLDALCDAWQVSAGVDLETERAAVAEAGRESEISESKQTGSEVVSESNLESRR
jgi:glutamyl-tRNA reductase